MELFARLFFLSIISCNHAEPLVGSLYGLKGGFHVTACSVRGAHCEGAMWLADWVLVHDSCIRAQDNKDIYVQKGTVNCTEDMTTPAIGTKNESSVRNVVARFSHTLAPDVDLALLRLDLPYAVDLDNRTLPSNALNILDIWIEGILYPSTEKTDGEHLDGYTQRQYRMYSSPIKMFFATVILPCASFIVFFLFIVFFTGTTDSSKIPYKTLRNDKKSNQV